MPAQAAPRPRPPRAAALLACAAFALALAAGNSFAQLPRFPGLTGKPDAAAPEAKPAAPETAEQAIARIRGQMEALGGQVAPAPDGISAVEADRASEARTALSYIYERQIRGYTELESARQARLLAESNERDWKGFSEKPPYSILMVDGLRETAGVVRLRISSLEAANLHLTREIARNREEAKDADAAQRAAEDNVAGARTEAEKLRAAWRRDAASLDARRSAGWAVLSRQLQEQQNEELSARRAELRLLERQIATATADVRFSDEDVDKVRQRSASNVASITKTLESVRAAALTRERERDAAKKELARLESAAGVEPERIAVAKARLRAATAWVETLRGEAEMLRGQIAMIQEFTKLWPFRRIATTSQDADARREAMTHLTDAAAAIERWLVYMQTPLTQARTSLRDAETRLNRTTQQEAATADHDRDAVAAAVQLLAVNEAAREELARISSTLGRWIADLKAETARRGFLARTADAWSAARDVLRQAWNFEIFAVEDTVMLDGRPVTTAHGVTVGKSVGAAAIFLGGYGLAVLLMRRLARLLIARGVDERLVGTLRRWTLAVVGLVLLLFTLNIAKIPLTVFAFLGGTLAIAVGFGTQTIFKNLISGMILLLERSVQIGDIVEVDGVSGTVTAVDLRSSTIKGFDGTDTIVPNSVLLENKFTNWTRNDRRVRRTVKVGVAYGSPVRQVVEILEDCAKRHGLVLDDPEPYAIFEDFGDNALTFTLYVWFEFRPNASVLVVLSDLRFMIERQFREAGIEIAFPQRDVHLDTKGPLRVELVRGGEPEPR